MRVLNEILNNVAS